MVGVAVVGHGAFALVVGGGHVDGARLHTGCGGTHLVGGTGGVDAQQGPVEQGVELVLGQLFVVLVVSGGVKAGVGGGGQNAAVFDVQHHGGGTALAVVDLGGHVRQRLFGGLLELAVQGQCHVAAHLGLYAVPFGQGLAVVAQDDLLGARRASQVLLKGVFRAGQPHDGVHVVVVLLIVVLVGLPAFGGDGAGLTQQQGGGAGVVLAGGHGQDLHAGQVLFLDDRDQVDVHVLGEQVGGVQHLFFPQISGVQHPQQLPRLALGVLARVQAEALLHLSHQLGGGGGAGVGPVHGLAQLAQTGLGPLAVVGLVEEGGVGGEGVGGVGGDGQVFVRPLHVLCTADVQQGGQGIQLLLGVPHVAHVQGHVVLRPVGHQHFAVAVGDVAPGGVFGGGGHHRVQLGGFPVAQAVDDGGQVEQDGEEQGDGGHQCDDSAQTPVV